MISLETIKNSDIFRYRGTIIKVFMNPRILILIGVLYFTIFSIGGDTVLTPNFTKLKAQDQLIENTRKDLEQKQRDQKQALDLQNELKNLTTQIAMVAAGNSPTVVAVSESAEILKIAKGASSNSLASGASKEGLPIPHNIRENVSLTNTGSDTLDIAQALEPVQAGSQTSVAAPSPMAGQIPNAASSATKPKQNVYRFNYELKATGTYPALIDFINQLALRKNLIKFNKITITPTLNQSLPNASDDPDYPVKLDMVASISLYLYDASGTVSPP